MARTDQRILPPPPNGSPTPLECGRTGLQRPVSVSWTAVAGATGYDVEVEAIGPAGGPEAAPSPFMTATSDTTRAVLEGLHEASAYRWRVRAVSSEPGPWSVWCRFETAPPAPEPFVLAPLGDCVRDRPVTLTWGASRWATSYEVEVARDGAFNDTALLRITPGTSVQFAPQDGQSYHWRVTARNGSGERAAGPAWFRTSPAPALVLEQPADAAETPEGDVAFTWSGGEGDLEVSPYPSFGAAVQRATGVDGASVPLAQGAFYWRARKAGSPCESWAGPRSLSVVEATATPWRPQMVMVGSPREGDPTGLYLVDARNMGAAPHLITTDVRAWGSHDGVSPGYADGRAYYFQTIDDATDVHELRSIALDGTDMRVLRRFEGDGAFNGWGVDVCGPYMAYYISNARGYSSRIDGTDQKREWTPSSSSDPQIIMVGPGHTAFQLFNTVYDAPRGVPNNGSSNSIERATGYMASDDEAGLFFGWLNYELRKFDVAARTMTPIATVSSSGTYGKALAVDPVDKRIFTRGFNLDLPQAERERVLEYTYDGALVGEYLGPHQSYGWAMVDPDGWFADYEDPDVPVVRVTAYNVPVTSPNVYQSHVYYGLYDAAASKVDFDPSDWRDPTNGEEPGASTPFEHDGNPTNRIRNANSFDEPCSVFSAHYVGPVDLSAGFKFGIRRVLGSGGSSTATCHYRLDVLFRGAVVQSVTGSHGGTAASNHVVDVPGWDVPA